MSPFKGINIPITDVYTKNNKMVIEAHLPDRADTEKIEARLDEGILKVKVLLIPCPNPRKLQYQQKLKNNNIVVKSLFEVDIYLKQLCRNIIRSH